MIDEERKVQQDGDEGVSGNEVLSPSWWQDSDDSLPEEELLGDYVMVEHEDVIQAMAEFLAAYLVSLPETKSMHPAQLQDAVRTSLKEIRKGKLSRAWEWGRMLYRTAALSYGAFAAYTNPWLAEAILRSIFTCIRFASAMW